MKDLGDLMKQAQAMQEKLQAAQARLAETEVDGTSGGDMVKVKASGKLEILSCTVSDEASPFTRPS